MKKGIIWLSPPSISGENLLTTWSRLMAQYGWDITKEYSDDSAFIFASSDSQLEKAIEIKNKHKKLPLVLYFWGYLPERFIYQDFTNFAISKCELIRNNVNIVFVPNQEVQNQLLYFGIRSSICTPGINSPAIISSNGIGYDMNRIVMIGRLAPHKSHLEILKTFKETGLSNKFCLHIIGKGEMLPKLQEFIKKNNIKVIISENIQDVEKIDILKSSLCSIYASNFEGFGAPIAESLFAGTPVIVLDSPWARSLYKDNVTYFTTQKQFVRAVLKIFSGIEDNIHSNPPIEFSAESLTSRLSVIFLGIIEQSIKSDLKDKAYLAKNDQDFKDIYQEEAIRNWDFRAYRFNPHWLRHWRVEYALKGLEGESIIDIGASYGSYAIRFAEAGFKVTAVDIAPFYIDKIKELSIKYKVEENILPMEANANSLPFEDNTFDSAWLGEILEHTDAPGLFLKEAIRVVKKGGAIVVSTPIGTHHNDPLHLTLWDDESLSNFLDGFKNSAFIEHLDKIAENQNTEPSCYMIKLRKI